VRRLVYRALRRFSALDRALRERLTPAGWLALGAAGAAGGTPVDTMLAFLAAPGATSRALDTSLSARVAGGAGGVFGFLASAARSLLGVGS